MRQTGDLALLAGISEEGMRRELEQWKAERRRFLVEHNLAEYVPLYALDPKARYRPYPAVKKIIDIFGGDLSDWAIASWFAGLNSFLDEHRPLDLLGDEPDWVIEAARDAIDGMTHTPGGTIVLMSKPPASSIKVTSADIVEKPVPVEKTDESIEEQDKDNDDGTQL